MNFLPICANAAGVSSSAPSPVHAAVGAVVQKHADLSFAVAYGSFAESAARLAGGSVEVAICHPPDVPYPIPGHLQVVALLDDDAVLISRSRRPDLRARFHAGDLRWARGKVWLVGMGPGDPELMTLKADLVLRRADIIFYDSLIDHSVLERYPAEHVHVGKRKGKHTRQQEEINALLYGAACAGRNVVRLKGGDPFIFGRGGEEAEYLRRRFVAVEVIPGVSAANAAAAAANAPLTKRGISRSLLFQTAHAGDIPAGDEPTRVFFMGASRLAELSRRLLRDGLDPRTPVTLVQKATFADEQSLTTTLSGLTAVHLASPLLVIVGGVAGETRAEGKCLFTGDDPYAFPCPERVVHFRFQPTCAAQRVPLDGYASVALTSVQAVDVFAAMYGGIPSELLYYCASADVQTRVRMHSPTASAVLCCCR